MRQKKRPTKRRSLPRALLAIFLCLLVFFAIRLYLRQDREIRRLEAEGEQLARDLETAQAEAQQIKDLRTMVGSKEFIERVARDELGLVRPEELIFIH